MTAFHRTREWQNLTRRMRPLIQRDIDAGMGVCLDCGNPVLPGQRWQVGHRLPASTHPQFALSDWNVGPSHSGKGNACNQRDGGKLGAAKTNAQRRKRKEFIKWR